MSNVEEAPELHEAPDYCEDDYRSGFVIMYGMVALSGAFVGFIAGWFCK